MHEMPLFSMIPVEIIIIFIIKKIIIIPVENIIKNNLFDIFQFNKYILLLFISLKF